MTPLYAAAGYVALILKAPQTAALLRSKFMRLPSSYESVFDAATPLEVWPKIVHILKRVDVALERLRPQAKVTDKFLKSWRYVTSFILLAQHFGRFTFTPRDVANFDVSLITPAEVERIWRELNQRAKTGTPMGGWASFRNILAACEESAQKYGIKDINSLSVRHHVTASSVNQAHPPKELTDEFISSVQALLPAQPWKPGIHRKITRQLRCKTSAFSYAVDRLIEDGHFLHQRNGVLYDTEGNVVSFDPDRVDPDTLELRPAKA